MSVCGARVATGDATKDLLLAPDKRRTVASDRELDLAKITHVSGANSRRTHHGGRLPLLVEIVQRGYDEDPRAAWRVIGPSTHDGDPPGRRTARPRCLV